MAPSSLGVLATDSQAPGVTETTMDTDLLHALKVLTELVVQIVGEELTEAAVLDVLLTIEEPVGDLVLAGVLHDGDDALQGLLIDLTSTTKSLGYKRIGRRVHTAWRCQPRPCGTRGWHNDGHNHGWR